MKKLFPILLAGFATVTLGCMGTESVETTPLPTTTEPAVETPAPTEEPVAPVDPTEIEPAPVEEPIAPVEPTEIEPVPVEEPVAPAEEAPAVAPEAPTQPE